MNIFRRKGTYSFTKFCEKQSPKFKSDRHFDSVDQLITFGKYKGDTISELIRDCPHYIKFLLDKNLISLIKKLSKRLKQSLKDHPPRVVWQNWSDDDYGYDHSDWFCVEWGAIEHF